MTSPYKWYGPHSGVLWMRPELLESLPVFKVRPAPDHGPGRIETGMPNFEAIAGIEAAARFLIEEGMDRVAAAEAEVFSHLLDGLQSIKGVTVWGSQTLDDRVPTAAFTIEGVHPAEASQALGAEGVAVWDGTTTPSRSSTSWDWPTRGGVVRAGVVRYIEHADVDRLLTSYDSPAQRTSGTCRRAGSIPGDRDVAQLVAHLLWEQGVGSSSLPIPTHLTIEGSAVHRISHPAAARDLCHRLRCGWIDPDRRDCGCR